MSKIAYYLMLACLGIGAALFCMDAAIMLIDSDLKPTPPISPDPILCMVIGVGAACLAYNEGGKP